MPTHHAIDYIEFTVTDMAQAQRFYATAFGWEFSDYGPGYAGIKGDRADKREAGGFRLAEPGESVASSAVLAVLWSDRIEDSLQAVIDAGGVVVKDIFAFPGGRRFEFLDPSRNRVAVWSDPAT